MTKRILILTLTLLFLVSTTGLPVTINLCKMADAEDADQCMMHRKPIKSMCCAEETSENQITFSSVIPNCCQTTFVYNKVEDEFVNSKTENKFYSSSEIVSTPVFLIPHTIDFTFEESCYNDSSPPFLINPELHITNSILLI